MGFYDDTKIKRRVTSALCTRPRHVRVEVHWDRRRITIRVKHLPPPGSLPSPMISKAARALQYALKKYNLDRGALRATGCHLEAFHPFIRADEHD